MTKIIQSINIKLDIEKSSLLESSNFIEAHLIDNKHGVYLLGTYNIKPNIFKAYYIGRSENLSQRIKEISEKKRNINIICIKYVKMKLKHLRMNVFYIMI